MSNKITTNIYPIYPFNASLLMDVVIIFFVKINKQGKVFNDSSLLRDICV